MQNEVAPSLNYDQLRTSYFDLKKSHLALLEASKRIVYKNGQERMIGSETAGDREALKNAIRQGEDLGGILL